MTSQTKGIITILTLLYYFQYCIHFLASVRKFHLEQILILIDRIPKILEPWLKVDGNVILQQALANENTVLSSRKAKTSLYEQSPFDKTIFIDSGICLLANISEIFDCLHEVDTVITGDVQPAITKNSSLLIVKQDVVPTLKFLGLPLKENSIQHNTGFIGFNKSELNKKLFAKFKNYFDEIVFKNQDVLLLRYQGAFAATMEVVKPKVKVLPPTYNFLTKWKDAYGDVTEPIKVLHCTYPYRPQYAKAVIHLFYTKALNIAKFILSNISNLKLLLC